AELVVIVVVEKRGAVIRQAHREPERDEDGRNNPPAIERRLLHSRRFLLADAVARAIVGVTIARRHPTQAGMTSRITRRKLPPRIFAFCVSVKPFFRSRRMKLSQC